MTAFNYWTDWQTWCHAVISALNAVAAAVVIWQALCALNSMQRQTRSAIKWAFRLIAVGGLAFMLHPPDSDVGGLGQVLLLFGLAAAFLFGRAVHCFACPARRRDRCRGEAEMKDCRDCTHAVHEGIEWKCGNPLFGGIKLPTSWRRHPQNECGPVAVHFKPKEEAK